MGGWEECCGYSVDQQWVGGWVGGKSVVVMVLTNSGWVGGWEECCGYGVDNTGCGADYVHPRGRQLIHRPEEVSCPAHTLPYH